MKTLVRKRAGGFERLVLMREKTYEDMRNAAHEPSKDDPTERGKLLVEKYLEPGAQPGTSAAERLSMYNKALASANATQQFSSTALGTRERVRDDDDDGAAESGVKVDAEVKAPVVELVTSLPDVSVPRQYAARMSDLKAVIQASGTVSIDKQGRVYLDGTLLDDGADYVALMRSLFVQSSQNDLLPGRGRFLQHLVKLGVHAKDLSARTAKLALKQLSEKTTKQLGGQKKKSLPKKMKVMHAPPHTPPGQRPKALLLYR